MNTIKTRQIPRHAKMAVDCTLRLEKQADKAIVTLFNATYASLRLSPRPPFVLNNTSIERARSIVQDWSPTKFVDGLDRCDFDVPYVLSSFFNRYISTTEQQSTDEISARTALKFLKANAEGRSIDNYVLEHECCKPLIERMRYYIGTCFRTPFQVTEIYSLVGHGPNSTQSISRENAFSHIKYRDMKGTRACLQQYLHYLSWDSKLHDILVDDNDKLRSDINSFTIDESNVCNSSKMSFAPKSYKAFRTIKPEPTTVAYMATGPARALTRILRDVCNIDLSTQPECHKLLAKLGSLYPELRIGTLDWSEASDRIWMSLCQAVFTENEAPKWLDYIVNVCRVPRTTLALIWTPGQFGYDHIRDLLDDILFDESLDSVSWKKRKNGSYKVSFEVESSMIATMGNPITFPLQTLVFWAFLNACTDLYVHETHGINLDPKVAGLRLDMQCPSSFGDDGIADSRVFPTIEYWADILGWKLNVDKSFNKGSFRESCGGDYYHGRECRPFQPKAPDLPPVDSNLSAGEPETSARKRAYQAWLYIVANNTAAMITKLGFDASLIELWLVEEHKSAKLGEVMLVPPSYPDGSGWRCDSGEIDLHGDYSFNRSDTLCALGLWSPAINLVAPHTNSINPFPAYSRIVYSWYERVYVFKCLVNVPDQFSIDEDWCASGYYYHDAIMQKQQLVDDASALARIEKLGFFDISKSQATLSNVPIKDSSGIVTVKSMLSMKVNRITKQTKTTVTWM